MIRVVVSPRLETSMVRLSSVGRSARLNDVVPVAWRWLISSATASDTRNT